MEIKTYLDAVDKFQKIYEGSRFKVLPHPTYKKYLSSKKLELPDRVLGYPIDFAYMPTYQKILWMPNPKYDEEKFRSDYTITYEPKRVNFVNPVFNYDIYVEFWSLFKYIESDELRKYFIIKSVEWDSLGGGSRSINYKSKESQEGWSAQGFLVCFESSIKEALKILS